jgi:hypothetical protein
MIDLGINLFQEIAALGGGGGGYSISNSLRFNDNDSAYLTRTLSVAGDARTATISMWIKRGNLTANGTSGSQQWLWQQGTSDRSSLVIDEANRLQLQIFQSGASKLITTTSVIRDVSGWYHIVGVIDIDNATSSDRLQIYINGNRISAFDVETQPSSGTNATNLNNTSLINIGRLDLNQRYFDGYMAEVNFIDGQALTADDFGEINEDTGEWSPKAYEGTYGTNGFYLQFKDGAALGDDTSGNTNDWTPTNLASTDQMLDTPTNNFATLNPLTSSSVFTISNGSLVLVDDGSASPVILGSIGVNSGKYYWEVYLGSQYAYVGAATVSSRSSVAYLGAVTGQFMYNANSPASSFANGSIYDYSTASSSTSGDVVGVALDFDTNVITFYKNGVSQGVFSSGVLSSETWVPAFKSNNSSSAVFNFGQDSSFAGSKTRQGNTDANGIGDFYYTPPTGYLALCTDNLAEPTIVDSETQFNVVTYTGTGSSNPVSGVGFQPDFVWIKNRSATSSNKLMDVVRGAGQQLESDTTNAEATNSNFASFDSDGFTVVSGTAYNLSGNSYVAWCWKAGGTAVTNTDGSITSQVSANVDAGFSIVGYSGNATAGATVGHGLSSAPEMIIVKSRNDVSNWPVYHVSTGNTGQTYLSATDAFASSSTRWNNTSPTSSVFSLGTATNVNGSGYNFVAYCFHSVEGFSKIGTYVGNGSTDGPFVYTGFRPAFLMIKASSRTGSWFITDKERSGYNGKNDHLYANLSNAEDSGATYPYYELLSNGFKLITNAVNVNESGQTYIYMAFAEAPFKNAVAR